LLFFAPPLPLPPLPPPPRPPRDPSWPPFFATPPLFPPADFCAIATSCRSNGSRDGRVPHKACVLLLFPANKSNTKRFPQAGLGRHRLGLNGGRGHGSATESHRQHSGN